MTSDPRLAIGANNPPSNAELLAEVLEALPETLAQKHEKIAKRAIDLTEAATRIPDEFTEQEQADNCTNFITLVQGLGRLAEDARKKEKDPFLNAGREVDNFFNAITRDMKALQVMVTKPLDTWAKKKRDEEAAIIRAQEEKARKEAQARADEAARIETEARLKREAADKLAREAKSEADKKAAEAAQKQAALEQAEAEKKMASAVKMETRADKLDNIATTGAGIGSTRTETGAMNVLVKTWKGRWENSGLASLDAVALWDYVPEAARETALNGLVKAYAARVKEQPGLAPPSIRGAVIWEHEETRVRK